MLLGPIPNPHKISDFQHWLTLSPWAVGTVRCGERAGQWPRSQDELCAGPGLSLPGGASRGERRDEPRAAPPVASGSHYGLSCVLPDQPLPNPFQHHFWFFSGDALCPARLHAHLQAPRLATCRALSGYSRWENDKWPAAEGFELLGLSGGGGGAHRVPKERGCRPSW